MHDELARRGFQEVRDTLLADPDDDVTSEREQLLVKGHPFAFFLENARLAVDLPERRAADLVDRGVAAAADGPTSHGTWVSVEDVEDWQELASEAHQFVGEHAVGRQS